MINFLKKIWTEITRQRAIQIEFINYETEEETIKRITREFTLEVIKIRERNSQKLYEKMIPQIAQDFTHKNGYIPSEDRLTAIWLQEICRRIDNGELDSLYNEI